MLLVVLGALLASVLIWAGCTNRVTGTQKENQKPVVYFVNIPPDGSTSSRNPLVYWAASDPDGRVRAFRYIVVLQTALGGQTPQQYSATINAMDSATFIADKGVYLRVDDSLPNPQTQAVVTMSADISDPVSQFVPQYVFLQAIDDRGLKSDVAYRVLKRNDNPPETSIEFLNYDEQASPFINAPTRGGLITGVRFQLTGDDPDYPVNPPPFQFQWKLFGPYTYDTITGGEYAQMLNMVLDTVFVTNDAKVYRFGQGQFIVFYCDSIDSVRDTVFQVPCDTLFIDTITRANQYGNIRTIANVDDSTFKSSGLYRPVDSSKSADLTGWVYSQYDTVYNVFRAPEAQSDSTIQRRFLLWARCRDDAFVPDLTPAYGPCGVIDPKFERDVLIVDFYKVSLNAHINSPRSNARTQGILSDSALQYWRRVLDNWGSSAGLNVGFDTTDYVKINGQGDRIDLKQYLQHKVAIMYNDDVIASGWYNGAGGLSDAASKTLKAVDAGVNVWYVMRTPFAGDMKTQPAFYRPDQQFALYFGVDSVRFTGWGYYANIGAANPTFRIEDFVGAYPLKSTWPVLAIDTANLHGRYQWLEGVYFNHLKWIDSLGALPEVGWAFRNNASDPLYLYKSMYGPIHPLGQQFSYEGAPCAHRMQSNLFRTVFFAFTPLGLQDGPAQVVVDSVMNWLYDKYLPSRTTTVDRYPDARLQISAAQIRKFDADRTKQVLEYLGKEQKPITNK